jgi:hypothetical protein
MDPSQADERHELAGVYGVPTQPYERNPRQRRVPDQHEWVTTRTAEEELIRSGLIEDAFALFCHKMNSKNRLEKVGFFYVPSGCSVPKCRSYGTISSYTIATIMMEDHLTL